MKIDQPFNKLTFSEYIFYIDNFKKHTDFNTLGLYRSLTENEILSLEEKITIREYANKTFQKAFNFLQVKDPMTFFLVSTLGENLTKADKYQIWQDIRKNQQIILRDKKIKHRNFGDYSKHNCGLEDCPFNGIMIKQGALMSECSMRFTGDKDKYMTEKKAKKVKSERKNIKKVISDLYDDE
jgi:hypothetical protein